MTGRPFLKKRSFEQLIRKKVQFNMLSNLFFSVEIFFQVMTLTLLQR